MSALPSLFLSHGSPMTALIPGEAGAFFQRLGPAIEQSFGRPRAIVALSAHTLHREPVLLAAPRHEAVHDFGGFDPALYTLRYGCPGAPALAEHVAGLLAAAGLKAHLLAEGGLDHGMWTPLRYAWPEASIPVLPLGWNPQWSTQTLWSLGQALAPLRHESVLVLGTGSITHNLRRVMQAGFHQQSTPPEIPESRAFRDWFAARSAAQDWPALLDYRRQVPHAVDMHPSDEHLLPWFIAAGAGGHEAAPLRLHDSVTHGCLGMDAYAFGTPAHALAAKLAA
jgi:4,5-DOPA dioxygenase extradiol